MADRSVVYRLKADVSGLTAGMRTASSSVKKLGDDMTGMEKSSIRQRQALSDVGDTAGKIGLAAATGLGLAAKAAVDWESAWAGVTKTVDGTDMQMGALEEGLRNLATELPATHDEIAGVAEAAGQLGVAREDILGFTRTMIDLSETTNLTAEDAATMIAQIGNVMQTAGDDIDNFGSALVALGNDGASTERDILEMAQRIAGTGAQIGLAESDILAISNAAASMGINAEAGGSAISKVFTELAKATTSGTPKLETFARTAGVTSEEFVKAFGEDPAQAFAMFTAGLDRVNTSGGDVFSLLKDLGMSDVRVSQAMLSMAASGDLLTDSLELGAEAWDENTALAQEAAKRYETTAAQTQIAWNNIKDAGIEAGEALLPVIAGVADGAASLAGAFADLPDPAQKAVTAMGGLTALFGGGLWFTSKVINGVANMRSNLDDLGWSAEKSGGKLGKLARGAGLAAGGLTVLSAAIAATAETDTVAGVEATEKAIRDLAGGADFASSRIDELFQRQSSSFMGDFEIASLADAFDALETNDFVKLWKDPIFQDSEWDLAKQSIEGLDTAMSNMVAAGETDEAAAMFSYFSREAEKAGLSVDDINNLLPSYLDALVGVEEETKGAAGETDAMAGFAEQLDTAMGGASDAMSRAEKRAEALKEKFERLNAVLDGRSDLRDYEGALDDFAASVKENGQNFDITTQKGRENMGALDGIAQSALNVAENLGRADRKKFLTGAIDDIRTMGQRMGVPKDQIRDLIGLLEEANRQPVKPKVQVQGLEKAMTDLYGLNNFKIDDKTFTIHAVRKDSSGVDFISGGVQARAAGGPIFGPGTATSDSIPALLSNGEHVWTAREVANAGGHAAILAMRSQFRYAQGGAVGVQAAAPAMPAGIDYDRLARAMTNVRPLYGDVHVSGDDSFRRALVQDKQHAAMGGF